MPEDRPVRLTSQLLVGLMVIGVGVFFTLDNLGLLDAWGRSLFRYWPAGLIAIGLVKLWQSREGTGGAFGGLLFTVAGGWLLLEQTTLIRVSFSDLWPLLLVFVGSYLVWQSAVGPRSRSPHDSNAVLNATAVLGGINRGNNSGAFKGGTLTAVMGGCELDLRQANLDGEAAFEVFALWGGIEIRVPDDWTVVSYVVPIMGAVEDKTRPPQSAVAKRLIMRGVVIMAGVEVKN